MRVRHVSVSGLFIVGSQNVKSGRELTKAATVANSAMEQVLSWPFEKVYGFPGGIALDQTKTWSSDLANPVTTGSAADQADWAAIANVWRSEVQGQLQGGRVIYTVSGIQRLPAPGNPGLTTFQAAQFLRVTVTVEWIERKQRRRHVTFEEIVL